MVTRFTFAAAFITLLILSACGGTIPPATGTGGQVVVVATPTFIPTLGVGDYQNFALTTEALNAAAQGTLQASIAEETRVAQLATAEAMAISAAATGTIQAIATGTAQAMSYSATSTAQVLEVTQQALEIRQTESAIVATSTAQAILNAQSAAAATQSAVLSIQQNNAAATQQAIDNQIRQAQADREINKARLSQWTPYFIILAAATIISCVGLFIWWRDRSAVRVVQNIAIMRQPDGTLQPMLVGNHAGTLALPAPKSDDSIIEGKVEEDEPPKPGVVPPADWNKFIGWRDDLNLPIGITLRRRPILINRNTEPHLLIFGGSGSGKTTSGLVPYVAAMVGAGVHAVIVNARGSDFAPFENQTGVTMAPEVAREQRPQMMADLLTTMVKEIDRRNSVLKRYGVRSWYELPPHAGESGEFLVAVDEFLDIVITSRRIDPDLVGLFWAKLINLTSEGRKYGAFVALTMTEPTARVLGDDGMQVRGQMARMGFNMKNANASRSILDNPRGFPNGSTGLPQGQFIAGLNGITQQAVAFYPTPQQVQAFLQERRGRTTELPETIMQLTSGRAPVTEEAWSDEAMEINQIFLHDAQPKGGTDWLTHEKAPDILHYAPQATSLRRIEARVFEYTGGQATLTVKGVLIARAVQLYANGTSPYDIERTLFGGPKSFSTDIIQEAITQYQQLPLAR